MIFTLLFIFGEEFIYEIIFISHSHTNYYTLCLFFVFVILVFFLYLFFVFYGPVTNIWCV